MFRKRSLLACLLMLCLLLDACSPARTSQKQDLTLPGAPVKETAAEPNTSDASAAPIEDTAQPEGDGTLELVSLPLPEGMAEATAQCLCGDRIYTGGTGTSGAVFGYTCSDRSRETLPLPDAFAFIYAMCETDGGFAVLCGSEPSAYVDAFGNYTLNENATGNSAF